MRKLTFIILLLVLSAGSYSQLIRFKIGPVIGLTSPTSDYSGNTEDFFNGTKYGMSSGINFGAMGKINIGPIGGRVSVVYSSLSNEGLGDPDYPNSSLNLTNSQLMFTLGAEFGFTIPFTPIRPYAGIDVLFTSTSGTFNFQGTQRVASGENDIASSSRTGLGFALGTEIGFGKTFILDLSLRYNMINLLGKEFTAVTNANRIDSYKNLNDDADPNYSSTDEKHPIGNDRQIATIQLQLGLIFGF
jgi:opacity protein-like surface antigen